MRIPLAYLSLLAVPVVAAHAIQAGRGGEIGLEVRERAMALVNTGQQISAAQAIYGIRSGQPATELSDLVDKGGLMMPEGAGAAPRAGGWRTDGRYAMVALEGDVRPLCAELSRQAGASRSGARAGVTGGGDQFGCERAPDGVRFVFRIR